MNDMFPNGSFGTPSPFYSLNSRRSINETTPNSLQRPPPGLYRVDEATSYGTSSQQNSLNPYKTHPLHHLSSQRHATPPSRDRPGNLDDNMTKVSNSENFSSMFYEEQSMEDVGGERKRIKMSSALSPSDSQSVDRSGKSSEANFAKAKRKRPKFIRKVTCQVCGDVANDHMHYGAIACYSCRAFFRRGVKSNAPYFCSQSQSCVINKQSRKHCQYCRFQKCMSIGMKGNWVMTEEDKIEKKEKAIIRRRWNQIKRFKKDPNYEEETLMNNGEKLSSLPPSNEMTASIQQRLDSKYIGNVSHLPIHTKGVHSSDMKSESEPGFSNGILAAHGTDFRESIIPSAAATARAVVSAAEHDHQLSQFPKAEKPDLLENGRPPSSQRMNRYSTNNQSFPNQSKYIPTELLNSYNGTGSSNLESYSQTRTMLPEQLSVDVKQECVDMESNTGSPNDRSCPLTPNDMFISTDTMKEYHSDSSESSRDYSPAGEDYSPRPRRTQWNSFPSLLLRSKGKLTFCSNLLNEPVMPFTREENALVANVISTEKETTQQMPISNDTLQSIMNAVKHGTTLSYKATLEGYTVCMKRIIKFATKIDLFREFCAQDQKNLLLTNTDMLVNIRSARMLRPGFNLQDQLSVVYGGKKHFGEQNTVQHAKRTDSSSANMPIKKRLEYQQIYSSPWASGEDEEKKFFSMMNTIFELQMDHTTTALVAMMALFSHVS